MNSIRKCNLMLRNSLTRYQNLKSIHLTERGMNLLPIYINFRNEHIQRFLLSLRGTDTDRPDQTGIGVGWPRYRPVLVRSQETL